MSSTRSELHSLAYHPTTALSCPNGSSLWDSHTLELLNADKLSLGMDELAPYYYLSPLELSSSTAEEFSSGYLEDALLEFSQLSKRRRLLPCNLDYEPEAAETKSPLFDIGLQKSFWNFNPLSLQLPADNLYGMNQKEECSDEYYRRTCMKEEESILLAESGTPEETIVVSASSESPHSSSLSSYTKDSIPSKITTIAEEGEGEKRKIRRKVAYPFELVKPLGGIGEDDDVTLNDINERILMPPTRPVRHPVGDFACRPCVSPEGPGLSGKQVVALTRIHTHRGRGTITIIRTKG